MEKGHEIPELPFAELNLTPHISPRVLSARDNNIGSPSITMAAILPPSSLKVCPERPESPFADCTVTPPISARVLSVHDDNNIGSPNIPTALVLDPSRLEECPESAVADGTVTPPISARVLSVHDSNIGSPNIPTAEILEPSGLEERPESPESPFADLSFPLIPPPQISGWQDFVRRAPPPIRGIPSFTGYVSSVKTARANMYAKDLAPQAEAEPFVKCGSFSARTEKISYPVTKRSLRCDHIGCHKPVQHHQPKSAILQIQPEPTPRISRPPNPLSPQRPIQRIPCNVDVTGLPSPNLHGEFQRLTQRPIQCSPCDVDVTGLPSPDLHGECGSQTCVNPRLSPVPIQRIPCNVDVHGPPSPDLHGKFPRLAPEPMPRISRPPNPPDEENGEIEDEIDDEVISVVSIFTSMLSFCTAEKDSKSSRSELNSEDEYEEEEVGVLGAEDKEVGVLVAKEQEVGVLVAEDKEVEVLDANIPEIRQSLVQIDPVTADCDEIVEDGGDGGDSMGFSSNEDDRVVWVFEGGMMDGQQSPGGFRTPDKTYTPRDRTITNVAEFFDGPSDPTDAQEARSRRRPDLNDDPPTDTYQEEIHPTDIDPEEAPPTYTGADDPPTDTYQEEIVTDVRLEEIQPSDNDPEQAPLTYPGPEEISPIFTGPEGIPLADIDPEHVLSTGESPPTYLDDFGAGEGSITDIYHEEIPRICIIGPEETPLRDIDQENARSTHIEIDNLDPGDVPFMDIDPDEFTPFRPTEMDPEDFPSTDVEIDVIKIDDIKIYFIDDIEGDDVNEDQSPPYPTLIEGLRDSRPIKPQRQDDFKDRRIPPNVLYTQSEDRSAPVPDELQVELPAEVVVEVIPEANPLKPKSKWKWNGCCKRRKR